MKINQVFIRTDVKSRETRKDNINRILNFAVKQMKARISIGGVHPTEICSSSKINEMIKGGIINAPSHNPNKLEEVVKYKIGNQEKFLPAEELTHFISHMNFWKTIIEKKINYSLIVHDDIVFDEEETLKTIDNVIFGKNKPDKFWLISFIDDYKHTFENTKRYNEDFNHIVVVTPSTPKCYVITYEGAKMLLGNVFPISGPFDFSINKPLMISKKGYFLKNAIAHIDPYIDLKVPLKPIKKIPKIDEFYLISIERSREKRGENIESIRKYVKDMYDKELNVSGVDGGKLTQEDLANLVFENVIEPTDKSDISLTDAGKLVHMTIFPNRDPYMNSGEIGCFLSHYNIWKEMIDKEVKYAIVMEDDAKINTKIFDEHLKKIMKNAPENFDIISIYKHENQLTRYFIPYNNMFDLIESRVWGTTAYIINLDGVKNLMKNIVPIRYPVDFAIHNYVEGKNSGYLYKERIIRPYDDISVIKH